MMTSSTTMWLFLTSFSLFIALSYQNVDYSIYPAIYAMDDWVELSDADMTVVVTDVKPIPPVGRADKDTLIYVGLVTYRDARCVTTIENLFKKAKNPDRVRIGIVQQRHTEDDHFDCINDYCGGGPNKPCARREQLRFIEFTHQDSRGPNHARYFQQKLIRDEEFCLQLDTHSDFITGWDEELLDMWSGVKNEYAILSTRPPDISVLSSTEYLQQTRVPFLCQATIDAKGYIVNLPPTEAVHLPHPILATLYSSGFSFSKCHAEHKVPNDPNLQLMYDGDEFVKFARLWTKGYDVYAPHKVVVAHDYQLKQKHQKDKNGLNPTEWEKNGMTPLYRRFLYERGVDRIATVLGSPTLPHPDDDERNALPLSSRLEMLGKYGLGNKRSLDEFIAFTGVDTRNKKVFQDRCRNVAHWVPYNPAAMIAEDNDPYVDHGDRWGLGPEVIPKGHSNIPFQKSKEIEVFPIDAFTSLDGLSVTNAVADNQPVIVEEEPVVETVDVGSDVQRQVVVEEPVVDREALLSRHRGGELWWIFQYIDSSLERIMNTVDHDIGHGHGNRVMKIVLLMFPIVLLLVYIAVSFITTGHLPDLTFSGDGSNLPPSKKAGLFGSSNYKKI